MSGRFSISPELLEEMHCLVTASVSGAMSAEESRRLEELICQDVAVCDLYLDLVHDWKALLVLSGHDGAEVAPEVDIARRQSDAATSVAGDAVEGLAATFPVRSENDLFDICRANSAPASGVSASYLHGAAGYFSSGWPVAYLVATVVLGVGLLIGAWARVSTPTHIADQSAGKSLPFVSPLVSVKPFVGRITGMVDCEWADRDTAVPGCVAVPLGRKYVLSSGLLEITYDTGAKVVLQGPVTYEVDSAAGGYLSVGKLTAELGERGEDGVRSTGYGVRSTEEMGSVAEHRSEIGDRKPSVSKAHSLTANSSRSIVRTPLSTVDAARFTIKTPTAIVTDLGTEFGVEVNDRGDTTSHVFRGLVNVQPVAKDGSPQGVCAELREHESVIVEQQSDADEPVLRRVAIEKPSFVRVSDMGRMVAAQPAGAFQRWQAYSRELRRDPSLLAYYDFQQRRGEPDVLPNVADNGGKSLDGVIRQAAWTTGRMPSKHALLFQNKDDCVEINLPRTADDFTLAAWVRPMSLHHVMNDGEPTINGILLSDNWGQPGQIHWQLDSDGRVVFAEFGIDRERNNREWRSSPAFEQGQVRGWTHLVVSMDRTGRAWFYVNGRLSDSFVTGDQERVPVCIGPARIGTWNLAPRTFGGRIDEMAIWGRLLSSDEIRQMFDAGKVN